MLVAFVGGCGVGEEFAAPFWGVLLLAKYCVANQ
jgi:hypothetical protein